jgi:hypothetical protein
MLLNTVKIMATILREARRVAWPEAQRGHGLYFDIGILKFEFVSDFVLRISDFKSVTLYQKKTYTKTYAFALATCDDH